MQWLKENKEQACPQKDTVSWWKMIFLQVVWALFEVHGDNEDLESERWKIQPSLVCRECRLWSKTGTRTTVKNGRKGWNVVFTHNIYIVLFDSVRAQNFGSVALILSLIYVLK